MTPGGTGEDRTDQACTVDDQEQALRFCTEVASRIAILNDTCGNLIQITPLKRWQGGRGAREPEDHDPQDAEAGGHVVTLQLRRSEQSA